LLQGKTYKDAQKIKIAQRWASEVEMLSCSI